MVGNCPLCMAYTTTEPPVLSDLANSPTGVPPTVSRTRLSFFPSRASSISLRRLSPCRTTRSPPPPPHQFAGFFPADQIQRLDSCELRERNDVLAHGRV